MGASHEILIVIPARGGSKGIPRKNLRSLAGRPLLYYVIQTALRSRYAPDVFVSTEDEEIAAFASLHGARVIIREQVHAQDDTTLDPVIFHALNEASSQTKKKYALVVTMQPTSPLLKTPSLDKAIEKILSTAEIDTIISAKVDTHLTWKRAESGYTPNYKERVNRQHLEPVYRETGGFLVTRADLISVTSRIGKNVDLFLLSGGEEIDIDLPEEWQQCEFHIKRKRILFVVSGHAEIGLGHVYNTLLLANEILNHQIEFLVDRHSELGFEVIASKNYQVSMQTSDNLLLDIQALCPDVVVNDCLDTSTGYMAALKDAGFTVINFEDLGPGARLADLVINAIYPESTILPKHYFGHQYFLLREEFFRDCKRQVEKNVKRVIVTFGGVDSNNFTLKVIQSIYSYCLGNEIEIIVVAGFGYTRFETLSPYPEIRVYRDAKNIAEHMIEADVAFMSAGRTTYEAASLRLPAIVLAQNAREQTHFFASAEYGFVNLGLGSEVSTEEILDTFRYLVESPTAREYMSALMGKVDIKGGRRRVVKLLQDTLENL